MVNLQEPFASRWKNKDPFTEIETLHGTIFRQVEKRRTYQFQLDGRSYFIKIHYGTTVKEIIKNLITLRLPVVDSGREWQAIHRLESVGVPTMKGVAFGKQGLNPITRKSFIITEDLNPAISLEDFCLDWKKNSPSKKLKNALIIELATNVRKMHQAGVNHRDCYLCHFLLDQQVPLTIDTIKLSVIDLHRAQIRNSYPPARWWQKDLIGLYFSSLAIGLTQRDIFLFLQHYFQSPLGSILQRHQTFFTTAQKKAVKIEQRTLEKGL